MRPDELIRLLTSKDAAERIAEAIEDPSLQPAAGWNLTDWACKRVPGAIIFIHHDGQGQPTALIVALSTPKTPADEVTQALAQRTIPVTIVIVN